MQKANYAMRKSFLVLLFLIIGTFGVWAQTTITGTVNDSTGEPMIGASVLVKGTTSRPPIYLNLGF